MIELGFLWFRTVFFVAVLFFPSPGRAQNSTTVVFIGGSQAEASLSAMRLAADKINRSGGIKMNMSGGTRSSQIEITQYPVETCDPPIAQRAALEVVKTNRPVLVIYDLCQSATAFVHEIFLQYGIIDISLTGAPEARNAFRMAPPLLEEAELIGAFLDRVPGARAVMLYDVSSYGQLAEFILKNTKQRISERPFDSRNSASYANIADGIDGQLVLILAQPELARSFAVALKQKPSGLVELVPTSVLQPEYWSQTREYERQVLFTALYDPRRDPNGKVDSSLSGVATGDPYAIRAYIAVEAWAVAAGKVGSFEMSRVVEALKGPPLPTGAGNVSFDETGKLRDWDYKFYQVAAGNMNAMVSRPPPPPPPPP